MRDPHFKKKGMLFSNGEVLKEAIRQYGIKNRYNLKLEKNDKKRVKVVCKVGCPWSLWGQNLILKTNLTILGKLRHLFLTMLV